MWPDTAQETRLPELVARISLDETSWHRLPGATPQRRQSNMSAPNAFEAPKQPELSKDQAKGARPLLPRRHRQAPAGHRPSRQKAADRRSVSSLEPPSDLASPLPTSADALTQTIELMKQPENMAKMEVSAQG